MEAVGFKASRNTSGQVTNSQKKRLLQLMQQHRCVGKGQFSKPNARKEHVEVWAAVSYELNALGGSHKSPNQWKNHWKPLDAMDKEVLAFFSSDMVDGYGFTPEIGLVTTAEIVDMVDDAATSICLDSTGEILNVFGEDKIMEFPLAQFEVVPDKPPKQCTNQNCVEEASTLTEAQHAQLRNILERQHQEHMDALAGIHNTLKALLETMAEGTVAEAL